MITPAYRYRAELIRVVDADTLYLRVDLGFRAALTIAVRLRDVDAPEQSTPEGKAATEFVKHLLAPELSPPSIVIESYKDHQTFARWVADVWVGDRLLADLLRENGHAKL